MEIISLEVAVLTLILKDKLLKLYDWVLKNLFNGTSLQAKQVLKNYIYSIYLILEDEHCKLWTELHF